MRPELHPRLAPVHDQQDIVVAEAPPANARANLLVGDLFPSDRRHCSLLSLWMTEAGYGAVTAASGNEALRQFYDHHPDLVILDLALPGLDGWQVIE